MPNEFEEMIAITEKAGVRFTIHHQRRWDKDYRLIKEVVESQTLGIFIPLRIACTALMATCMTGTFIQNLAAACCMTGAFICWTQMLD